MRKSFNLTVKRFLNFFDEEKIEKTCKIGDKFMSLKNLILKKIF
jgi:molecular chaperone GrpE (heat shock protein)